MGRIEALVKTDDQVMQPHGLFTTGTPKIVRAGTHAALGPLIVVS